MIANLSPVSSMNESGRELLTLTWITTCLLTSSKGMVTPDTDAAGFGVVCIGREAAAGSSRLKTIRLNSALRFIPGSPEGTQVVRLKYGRILAGLTNLRSVCFKRCVCG